MKCGVIEYGYLPTGEHYKMASIAQVYPEAQPRRINLIRVIRAWFRLRKRQRADARFLATTRPATPMYTHFSLRSAYLCVQCECVTNNSHHCSSCTSTGLIPLASTVLNG